MPDPTVRFSLLGRFAVRAGGEEIPPAAFGGRLVRALVRILLTRRGTLVPKDVLADALWGDRPPADPARNLEILVSRARRALPDPALIETGPGGYLFTDSPACVVDAERFVALSEEARHELARRYLDALEGAAAAAMGTSSPGSGSVSPTSSDSTPRRRWRSFRRGSCAARCHQHRRLPRSPCPCRRTSRQSGVRGSRSGAGRAARGRERAGGRSGHGTGRRGQVAPPGGTAAREPSPVLLVRAFAAERDETWSLARSLLREALALDVAAARGLTAHAARALVPVLPEIEELREVPRLTIDPESRRALALEGAVRLIEASGVGLVLIDDPQWADATSLALVASVADRTGARLGLACRAEDVSPGSVLAQTLEGFGQRGARRLPLAPLTADALAELVGHAELARVIAEGTDNTPLAVLEVLRSLTVEGLVEPTAQGRYLVRDPRAVQEAARPLAPATAGPSSDAPSGWRRGRERSSSGWPSRDARCPPGSSRARQEATRRGRSMPSTRWSVRVSRGSAKPAGPPRTS
jgi:DNA-binding winged helix-turn-helix (wHTH) protein